MRHTIAVGLLVVYASMAAAQQPPVVPDPASPPTVEEKVVVKATRTEGRLEGRNVNGGIRISF